MHRKLFMKFFVNSYHDSITLDQVFSREEYQLKNLGVDLKIKKIYEQYLENNVTPLIIDCGSNIGLSAKYFSIMYPEAAIIGIEPDKDNVALAIKNNNSANVSFIKGAILHKDGYCEFLEKPNCPNNQFQIKMNNSKNASSISAFSVPTIVNKMKSQHGNCELLIVKIDVEGSEFELFSENTNWIDQCDLLYVELHDWMLPGEQSSKTFLSRISSLNRDFLLSGENVVSIKI
ncbi:FkbM family methyltransferase [Candidatus Pseudothioglobus singularis]|nr:FkbM family methyltransferase [Candidatus Pseudothioglobus singularis]